MCYKRIGWIITPACSIPMIGNGFLPDPASSGKQIHPPCTLCTNVPKSPVLSQISFDKFQLKCKKIQTVAHDISFNV
jgi:hypothetical protein